MHLKYKLQYSFAQEYPFTLNATPNDSNITLTVGSASPASGVGTITRKYARNTNLKWRVDRRGYAAKEGTYTTTNQPYTMEVSLETLTPYTLTVNPTPSDALVTIREGNNVLVSDFGPQTANTFDTYKLTYEISKPDYLTKSGEITMQGKNETLNIKLLTNIPAVEYVNAKNTDSKTAVNGTFNVPSDGIYLFEIWGGHGGLGNSDKFLKGLGGLSGHLYGVMELHQGDNIYYSIGGDGGDQSGIVIGGKGGANNGGTGSYGGAGGGGYSSININDNAVTEDNINNGKVLFIAGGGGGGSGPGKEDTNGKAGVGGNGGTLTSPSKQITSGIVFNGENGGPNNDEKAGVGGKDSGGGGFLTGENATTLGRGGGGGAGYYGGTGGAGSAVAINPGGPGGGGGGSSYISNQIKYNNIDPHLTETLVKSNPSSTGGAVIIKLVAQ